MPLVKGTRNEKKTQIDNSIFRRGLTSRKNTHFVNILLYKFALGWRSTRLQNLLKWNGKYSICDWQPQTNHKSNIRHATISGRQTRQSWLKCWPTFTKIVMFVYLIANQYYSCHQSILLRVPHLSCDPSNCVRFVSPEDGITLFGMNEWVYTFFTSKLRTASASNVA